MSWREEERKREKKMPFIVATYVYASSQGQRTNSAQTNISLFRALGKKSNTNHNTITIPQLKDMLTSSRDGKD
jgi:hypothetical protein